ncbi:MAG: protein kinase [Deltaproteobacteria bacterium]|nr:protein kinase [Deltaproteobacteria bacterium]
MRRLGRGATGSVYLAHDPQLGREVALKVIHVEGLAADVDAYRDRIRKEAMSLALVSSEDNVIEVHEVGEHQGDVFIAMQYVPGSSMRSWIRELSPSWREVLSRYREAGLGLLAAHGRALVHRDFKPDNVLINHGKRRAYVVDFGLAQKIPAAECETPGEGVGIRSDREPTLEEGAVVGTPAYMSPEQARGRADARSDQFSFCAAVYEGLFGERPFSGRTVWAIQDQVWRGAPQPSRLRGVPRRILRALQRGMSPEPGDRFASMEVLLRVLDHERRRRVWVAAGVSLSVTALLVVAAWPRDRCGHHATQARSVWSQEAREQAQSAFVRAGADRGGRAFERLDRAVNGFVEGWVPQRTAACEAEREPRRPNEEPPGLGRGACLDERLLAVSKIVEQLVNADAALLDRVPQLVHRMPSLQPCFDAVGAPDVMPAVAGRLDEALAAATALNVVGRFDEAAQVVEAERSHWEPSHWYEARFSFALGEAKDALGDPQARAVIRHAAETAEQRGQEYVAWRAWVHIADEARMGQGDIEQAEQAVNYAASVHRRLAERGDRQRRHRHLQGLQANIDLRHEGRRARARAAFRDVLDWSEDHDAPDLGLGAAQSLLAMAVEDGDPGASERYSLEVVRRTDAFYLGNPYQVAMAHLSRGTGLVATCQWDAAVQSFQHARASFDLPPASEGSQRLDALMANAYLGGGHTDHARGQLVGLLDVGDGISRAMAALTLGSIELGEGRFDQAFEAMDRAAKIFAVAQRPDLEAIALLSAAETELHRGRPRATASLLERARGRSASIVDDPLWDKVQALVAIGEGRYQDAATTSRRARGQTDRCAWAELADLDLVLATAKERGEGGEDEAAEVLRSRASAFYARLGPLGARREALLSALLKIDQNRE